MNSDNFDTSDKKSIRRIIVLGAFIILVVVVAAAIGFFATQAAVRTADDQAVKDEIITQNSRLRQSAVNGVLSGDMVARTKSTDTVIVELKVASDGKQYCIEAALRKDTKLSRYHMNSETPELEPQSGLCGEGASERPAIPTEFTLAAIGSGSLSFTWGAIPDASSYEVSCSAPGEKTQTQTTRKNAVSLESVKAGVVYSCRVSAQNSAGKSGDSASVSASAKSLLAVPQEVKLKSRTASSLSFEWGVASGAKYYVFEYAQDESFTKNVKRETVTSSQITISGLPADMAYYAHVKVVTQTSTEQQAPYSKVVQGRTEK